MRCDCGEQQRRTFQATIDYTVYFDSDRTTVPLRWREDALIVCIGCGEISGLVPGRVLLDLKAGGGESVA
jgi:hypothetical protein